MTDADQHPGPCPVDYDTELRRHDPLLRRACSIQPGDHVLDIGCGTGQTTRQAARTARAGSALGVDVSAPAIERAREFARAEARLDRHRPPPVNGSAWTSGAAA